MDVMKVLNSRALVDISYFTMPLIEKLKSNENSL